MSPEVDPVIGGIGIPSESGVLPPEEQSSVHFGQHTLNISFDGSLVSILSSLTITLVLVLRRLHPCPPVILLSYLLSTIPPSYSLLITFHSDKF